MKCYTKVQPEDRSLYAFIGALPSEIRIQIISFVDLPEITLQFYRAVNDVKLRRSLADDLCYIIIDLPSLEGRLPNPTRINNNHIYLSTNTTGPLEVFADFYEYASFESESYVILRTKESSSSSSLASIYGMSLPYNLYDYHEYENYGHRLHRIEEVFRSTNKKETTRNKRKASFEETNACLEKNEQVKLKFWERLIKTGNLRKNVLIEVHNFQPLAHSPKRYKQFKEIMELFGVYMGYYTEPCDVTKKYHFASYSVCTDLNLNLPCVPTGTRNFVNIGLNFVGIDKYNL